MTRGRKREIASRLGSRRRKAYDVERQLVAKLRDLGYDAYRIPLSNPSAEQLPDVFATKRDSILAFEVKYHEKGTIYIPKNQVEKLLSFLTSFQPFPYRKAVIACKFKRPCRRWVFKVVEKAEDVKVLSDDESGITL